MSDKPNYWAVIPATVRYDEELPPNAKLLYGEISSLTDMTGFCFASNSYFEELYALSERTISRLLKTLEARGYIRIVDGSNGKRKIFAGLNPLNSSPDKNDGVTPTKMSTHPDKNVGHNNKLNNNGVNSNKYRKPDKKNKFNNFDQRDYGDMSDLERKLLECDAR